MESLFPSEPKAKVVVAAARPRNADEVYEAVVEKFYGGLHPATAERRSEVNRLVREFGGLNATREEIFARSVRYKQVMPNNCVLTANALIKHWHLAAPRKRPVHVAAKDPACPYDLLRAELRAIRPDLAAVVQDAELQAVASMRTKAMAKWSNPLPGGNRGQGPRPCLSAICVEYLAGLKQYGRKG